MSTLYIQEFVINRTATTSDQTYLNGVSDVRSTENDGTTLHSYQTTGYQWCMDIHNSSTNVLDLSQWRLNICVNYFDSNEGELEDEDHYIYFRDLIINDNVVGGAVFSAGISEAVSVGDKLYVRPAITINSAHSSGYTGTIDIIGGSSGNISKYVNKKVYHLVGTSFEEIGTVTATGSNTMTIGGGGTLRSVSINDVIYFDSGVTVVSNSGAASQGSSASTVNIPVSNHVSDFVTETIFNESNADNLGTLSSSTILLQGYAPSLITIGYDPSLFGFERLGHTILANYPNATGATGNSNSNSVYHGISSPSSAALKLLPDYEYATNKYFYSTRFKLERSGQGPSGPWTNNFASKAIIDMFGDATTVDGDNYFTNSMVQRILGVSNAISMKKWGVGPTASYDEDANWNGTTANGGPRIFTLSSGAIGDPHISTLTGDHYKFDYLGAFRMFDNNDLDHRIVVNGFSENGPDRWSDKQYITKLYFHENGKSMLITNGFRGEKAKVLLNEGFIIPTLYFIKHNTSSKGITPKILK